MIEAIIFDLDGVISNTDRTRFDLLKRLLVKRNLVLEEESYKRSVGKRTEIFLKELFGDILSDGEIKNIYQERKTEYHKNPSKYVLTQPYSFECCKELFEAGFVLAIASAAETRDIKLVLQELKIAPYFKEIIGSDIIKNTKPHPETYLKCVESLDLRKEECVAIEDSPTGIKSAKSAGIKCIAVTYTHEKDELEEADWTIASLKELNRYFINSLSN